MTQFISELICWFRGHDFYERQGYGGYVLSPCRRCGRLRGFL